VTSLTGSSEHVGIGTDMSLGSYPEHERDDWGAPDYGNPFAEYGVKVTADPRSPRRNLDGFSDYAEVPFLAERLERRGYSTDDVKRILGENYLRVASAVWPDRRS
jgi:membrane dipeptidase